MTRLVGVLVVVVLALAGCGADDLTPAGGPSDAPAAGATDVGGSDLAGLKADAGIEGCPPTGEGEPVPDGLPAVTLDCLGGGDPVDLAALPAKPAVVNLWASWCGPCRDELPYLARLHDEAGDELTVLGIDYRDPDPAAALELAAESGVTYPLVSDPDEAVRDELGVIGLPQTVLVDASGTIVTTERRPFTSYEDLAALVREQLGVEVG